MRLITGVIAGALIGTAASVMMMPRMSSRVRRRINRTGRRMAYAAGDMFDGLTSYIK